MLPSLPPGLPQQSSSSGSSSSGSNNPNGQQQQPNNSNMQSGSNGSSAGPPQGLGPIGSSLLSQAVSAAASQNSLTSVASNLLGGPPPGVNLNTPNLLTQSNQFQQVCRLGLRKNLKIYFLSFVLLEQFFFAFFPMI